MAESPSRKENSARRASPRAIRDRASRRVGVCESLSAMSDLGSETLRTRACHYRDSHTENTDKAIRFTSPFIALISTNRNTEPGVSSAFHKNPCAFDARFSPPAHNTAAAPARPGPARPGEPSYAVRHCRSHAGRPKSVEAISLEQKGHGSPSSSSACVQPAHVMVCPHLQGQMATESATLARHRSATTALPRPARARALPSGLEGSPEQAGGRHLVTPGHAARTGKE